MKASLQQGKTYVFFIKPGWIIGGTVTSYADGNGDSVTLKDAVYVETVSAGHSCFSMALAETLEEQKRTVGKVWNIPHGMIVSVASIGFAVPAAMSFAGLAA